MRVEVLLYRLFAACRRLPDFGGDLWSRGLRVIERKCSVEIWLDSFVPSDVTEGEMPQAVIDITRFEVDS